MKGAFLGKAPSAPPAATADEKGRDTRALY